MCSCSETQGPGGWHLQGKETGKSSPASPLPPTYGAEYSHGRAAAVVTLPSLSPCLSPTQGPSVQEDWDGAAVAVVGSGLSLTLCRGVGTITCRPLPLMPSRWKMGVLGMLGLCTMEKREGEGEGARELTALEQREVLMSKEWSRSRSSSWSGPPWNCPEPAGSQTGTHACEFSPPHSKGHRLNYLDSMASPTQGTKQIQFFLSYLPPPAPAESASEPSKCCFKMSVCG